MVNFQVYPCSTKKAYRLVSPSLYHYTNITGLPLRASMMVMYMCCLYHLRGKNKRLYQQSKIKILLTSDFEIFEPQRRKGHSGSESQSASFMRTLCLCGKIEFEKDMLQKLRSLLLGLRRHIDYISKH
jgi:hypothetical protein